MNLATPCATDVCEGRQLCVIWMVSYIRPSWYPPSRTRHGVSAIIKHRFCTLPKGDFMIREPKLYDTVFNDDGSFYKVNTRTGECVDTGRYKPIWDTDLVISGKQQAAQKEYKQEQEKRAKRRDYSKKNGNHFFVPRSSSFPDLKPQTVARLVYLFTFANYSEQGSCLMWTQRKQMTIKKLPSVLGLSADTVAAFLQTC